MRKVQGWFFLFVVLTTTYSTLTKATVIAIIDSGTDDQHEWLSNKMWSNPGEIADNARDDDGNLYPDDVHGWNFAENNSLLIDRSFLALYNNQDIFKFFEVQKRMISGTSTEEDRHWLEAARKNKKLMSDLQAFGNFVHGTHVAGIASRLALQPKVMGLKIIPTKVANVLSQTQNLFFGKNVNKNGAFESALTLLAQQSSASLIPVGDYIGKMKAEVANGSFGVGPTQAANIVTLAFRVTNFRKPKEEELKAGIKFFLEQVLLSQKAMIEKAPKTLFVFAAGNDGTNNDELPTAPSSLNADNTISVAATVSDLKLAGFSNYGIKRVDVAAPGVGILSSIPGNRYLEVSGTSQAAPAVAAVAARLKEIRPQLTPKELKSILVQTVDKKNFLKDKVVAEGMVNSLRAYQAAENLNASSSINTKSVAAACSKARKQVGDIEYNNKMNLEEMNSLDFATSELLPLFQ
ncbi:MAG: S8 family serine peptidase [Bacteriovoracaceae bacterium]|nr:S8 family serine peptidase [Bacteriovoracaceae bacterium]